MPSGSCRAFAPCHFTSLEYLAEEARIVFDHSPMTLSRPARVAIFSALMIMCAAAGNAVMDCLSSRYDRSVFMHFENHRQWLDPRISWKNKWRDGDPKKGDAFFLSSTSLAPLTDAWHCFKALTILFLALAILAPFTLLFRLPWFAWVMLLFGIDLLYGLIFEGLYAHLLILG